MRPVDLCREKINLLLFVIDLDLLEMSFNVRNFDYLGQLSSRLLGSRIGDRTRKICRRKVGAVVVVVVRKRYCYRFELLNN